MVANYTIAKDHSGNTHIDVHSCTWNDCMKIREITLQPSTDINYPMSDGWFEAAPLHRPAVHIFLRKVGDEGNVVYKNSQTGRVYTGSFTKIPLILGKDSYSCLEL